MNVHAPLSTPDAVSSAPRPILDGNCPPVARLEAVSKIYHPRGGGAPITALDDVSLSVGVGEIVGVIGRSGAGKSTLVRLVNGLDQPTCGVVTIAGMPMSGLNEWRARQARRSIGMVFQHFNLLSSLTAAGNVALPLEIAGIGRQEIAHRVAELLELVGLATESDRYPSELSGGQKQRVGIARALAARPKLLLCDEATSALDPETTAQILSLIARIRTEFNLSILLITHEMTVVKAVADRLAVLEAGRIVEQGPVFELFARPRHQITQRFVAGVSGATLPSNLDRRLGPSPIRDGKALIRITFTGPQATEPVLSRIARLINVDLNIVSGRIEDVGGRPLGSLIVAIPGDAITIAAVEAALTRLELAAEVLGHVA